MENCFLLSSKDFKRSFHEQKKKKLTTATGKRFKFNLKRSFWKFAKNDNKKGTGVREAKEKH